MFIEFQLLLGRHICLYRMRQKSSLEIQREFRVQKTLLSVRTNAGAELGI